MQGNNLVDSIGTLLGYGSHALFYGIFHLLFSRILDSDYQSLHVVS